MTAGISPPAKLRNSRTLNNTDVVCGRCGARYPIYVAEVFFRRNSVGRKAGKCDFRSVCIGCEQAARDESRQPARWIGRARDTIKAHAHRAQMPIGMFGARYGWDVARIAHDLEHAFENSCVYCRHPYSEMGHGLADITLDIVDPAAEPHYATNVRPCCRTCNAEKGTLTPAQWARKRLGRDLWRAR